MTQVSQIVTDAYRKSNLIAIGQVPSAEQQVEAVRELNRFLQGALGNEIGDPLDAFPIGRVGIAKPSGYPWWDTVPDAEWFVPKNTRLMCNLDESLDIYLHPTPDDGTRFAINDVSGSFGTLPVTIHGNGALIAGAGTLVLDESNFEGEYFYRSDLGQWMQASPLEWDTEFPFPLEFDHYFITLLAMSLNPAYGVSMDPQTAQLMARSKSKIVARYKQDVPQMSELALLRLTKTARDRDRWGSIYNTYYPSDMFNKGWPF